MNFHRAPEIYDAAASHARTQTRLFSGKDVSPEPDQSLERRREEKDDLDKESYLVKPGISLDTFTRVPQHPGELKANYDPRNFSFRLKDRENVVVEESSRRCSWRDACCSSLYLGVAAIILTLIVFLLSTSPHHYRYCTE